MNVERFISLTGFRQSSTATRTRNTMEPNSQEDEDEQLQRAIRESLRQQRNESTPPPGYGWNIPDDSPPTRRPGGNMNNLYPDLNDRTFNSASAPPPENDTSLPYPPSNEGWNAPYPPPPDYEVRSRRPLNERYSNEQNSEDIRNARLRRFEKRN